MFIRRFYSNVSGRVGRLNHIAIAVPNAEKHIDFFKNVLRAPVSEKLVLSLIS